MRKLLLTTSCVAGMLGATVAWAQTETAGAKADVLEEIIVTAERRTADLQKTSISMTAISGDTASEQGQNDIRDILKDVPGVVVEATARGSAVSIRGLGFDLPPQVGENAVSMNFDGIYNVRSEAGTYGFFDMARIEVLRGPQGTLYGRNSTGGVVNVVSNNPSQQLEASGALEYGSYNLVRAEGAFNIPLSKDWAARAAFVTINRDGYLNNGHNDAVGTGARLKTLYKPDDDFSWLTSVEYSKIGGHGPAPANGTEFDAGHPLVGVDIDAAVQGTSYTGTPGIQLDDKASNYYRSYRVNMQIDAKVGPGVVTFIPAYQGATGYNTTAEGSQTAASPAPTLRRLDDPKSVIQRSAELRYASEADAKIIWVGGLYYYDLVNVGRSFYASDTALSDTTSKTRSIAAFGQVTIPFTESFRGIAGVRESRDKKSYFDDTLLINAPPGFKSSNEDSRSAFDWKVGLEKDLSKESMAYLTISTGHRPGGFNILAGSTANVTPGNFYDPESLLSYEIGSKNRFLDNRLQINGGAFYYDYKKFQLADIYALAPVLSAEFLNANARIYGGELEARALLGAGVQANVGVNYLNATLLESVKSGTTLPFLPPYVVQKGDKVSHSPDWTVNAGLEWAIRVGSKATLTPRAEYRYVGDQYVNTANNAADLQKAYSTGDLSLQFAPIDGNWNVNVYCKNVNDKVVKLFLAGTSPQVSAPRTYGIVFSAHM